MRGAVTGSYSRSGRLQFSQSETAKQTHMPLLQHTARAQEPSQSHAPREAENMLGTLTLAKHSELLWVLTDSIAKYMTRDET